MSLPFWLPLENYGSPRSRAKDDDTPINSPLSREEAIESLSPSSIVTYAADLFPTGAESHRVHVVTQRKMKAVETLISRVLSFTFDDQGSCPSSLAAPGYIGPLYIVELCSPSRVVFLTGWKAQVEHMYRVQQANMLWSNAYTEYGSLKGSLQIGDMEKVVSRIMNKLITDEDVHQWIQFTEHPILMPTYTEELKQIRSIALSSLQNDHLNLQDMFDLSNL